MNAPSPFPDARETCADDAPPSDAPRLPETRTAVMLDLASPARAADLAALNCAGVGLFRTDALIAGEIGIHPAAAARFPHLGDITAVAAINERAGGEDPREFFVRSLAGAVARVAAAFRPRPVVVRTSDLTTDAYARLLGGDEVEATEENPMLGLRGAARYLDPRYAGGFALECEALARVRREAGLTNVHVLIPFCRTLDEADRVIEALASHGLVRGAEGLRVLVSCEVPANVVLAAGFLEAFDGFEIDVDDLTQLVLGVDRSRKGVPPAFGESDEAVRLTISAAIDAAQRAGKRVGAYGAAVSGRPDFVRWLVERGADSVSVEPAAVAATAAAVAGVEQKLARYQGIDRVLYNL